jgi:hypothetical protein
MQGLTSSARISWFFIALNQKSGTPFSSAGKHYEKGQRQLQFTYSSFIIRVPSQYENTERS